MEHLGSKIRILVTHQIQFIEKATKILILKEGECLAYGTFKEIQQMGIDFVNLLENYRSADDRENVNEEKKKGRSLSELSDHTCDKQARQSGQSRCLQ